MIRIAFHTLGCKVNQYESEALAEKFASRGAVIVPDTEAADVYIVNTCSVTSIADRKSRQFIRRMKRLNPDALMVVTGCYAQVSSEELERMPDVDLIIGNNLKSEIPNRVAELLSQRSQRAAANRTGEQERQDISQVHPAWGSEGKSGTAGEEGVHVACRDSELQAEESMEHAPVPRTEVLAYKDLRGYEDMGIVTASESGMSRAYIKIQEGCNRFCSYCLIPYARGIVRSRPLAEVLEEAKMLLSKGFHELVLTGINTALYGEETGFDFERLPGEEQLSGLEALIRRLDAMEGNFRIRLSSLEPTVVDIEHIERIVQYGKLCHHLHLSLQSGSNAILDAMNRHYTREDYFRIVQALRDFDPNFGITTDIIVGFPGETEEDFEDSLDAVDRSTFGKVHVFRYSVRKGTKAATFPDMISGKVKGERASRLEKAAEETALRFHRKNLGGAHVILAEKNEDGMTTGYTGNYIKVYIPDAEGALEAGEFYDVRLVEIYKDGCLAEVIGKGVSHE